MNIACNICEKELLEENPRLSYIVIGVAPSDPEDLQVTQYDLGQMLCRVEGDKVESKLYICMECAEGALERVLVRAKGE